MRELCGETAGGAQLSIPNRELARLFDSPPLPFGQNLQPITTRGPKQEHEYAQDAILGRRLLRSRLGIRNVPPSSRLSWLARRFAVRPQSKPVGGMQSQRQTRGAVAG